MGGGWILHDDYIWKYCSKFAKTNFTRVRKIFWLFCDITNHCRTIYYIMLVLHIFYGIITFHVKMSFKRCFYMTF